MAPAQKPTTSTRAAAVKSFYNNRNFLQKCYGKYLNFDFVKCLIFDPEALPIVSVLILFAEFLLNIFIIERVPYTEIDWKAYMQECEGFINGTTNYALLKGDTGPLVYPAAFVYIYTLLYYITSHGQNIHLAQYIFGIIYLLQMYLVLRLYSKSRKVPPYILAISAFTSYRIHSIYVLRLFNDPIAILFLYAALNLFLGRHWSWGSICYSLGVACKMNILLCSPALFLFYIISLGFSQALVQLCICAVVQLVVGLPFLYTYPLQYITGSFNLGRVFEHKWTVNYRFLPVEWFESKHLHIGLLVLNILLILLFIKPTAVFFKNYVRLRELQKQFEPQIKQQNQQQQQQQPMQPQYDKKNKQKKYKNQKWMDEKREETLTAEQEEFLKSFERGLQRTTGLKQPRKSTPPLTGDPSEKVSVHFDQCSQLALLPIFVCNFIGVMCARSLHYQFYVWYFHSLPYMAWCTPYSLGLRCLLLGLIEYCWNTYPSTNFSSFLLHLCHVLLLIGVGHNMFKTISQSQHIQQQSHQQQQDSNENGSLNLVKDKNK